jgi:hypothetical protein
MNNQDKQEYFRKYRATHREQVNAYSRKSYHKRNENQEYHHRPPKAKTIFCSNQTCGKPLDHTRYSEHYCSPECYFRSLDKYRPKSSTLAPNTSAGVSNQQSEITRPRSWGSNPQ